MHKTISQDNHLMLIAEVQKKTQYLFGVKNILNSKHMTKCYNYK